MGYLKKKFALEFSLGKNTVESFLKHPVSQLLHILLHNFSEERLQNRNH